MRLHRFSIYSKKLGGLAGQKEPQQTENKIFFVPCLFLPAQAWIQ